MSSETIEVDPPPHHWRTLLDRRFRGTLGSRSLDDWRALTRRELGLEVDRPILATGHQTMLWHPGILAKYLVTDAVAEMLGVATANLVVDQHVGEFGDIDVPIRADDGHLAVATYHMSDARPEVPMGLHPSFTPRSIPRDLRPALESVDRGIREIHDAVAKHQHAGNAACQMSLALTDMMRDWVRPMADVTSAQLIATTLGRFLLERMIEAPETAVQAYNRAVTAVPEGGIGPLDLRAHQIELPVWKIDATGRRVRGFEIDVTRWLDDPGHAPAILPRALLMTALVRLGMCDLFVHGRGGATYDRAMELWVKSWLAVEPCPTAVVTATLCLPLGEPITDDQAAASVATARRARHDPRSLADHQAPSAAKRELLQKIASLPRRSRERRVAYAQLHQWLEAWRAEHADAARAAETEAAAARRRLAERSIVTRRTWAFPLYPREMLDSLAKESREAAQLSGVAATAGRQAR